MNNLQKQSELVIRTLQANKNNIGLVTPFDFSEEKITILDFTSKNTELSKIDLTSTERMNEYVFGLLEKNGTSVGQEGIWRIELFTVAARTLIPVKNLVLFI